MIARYLLGWLLLVPLAILNGTVRQFTYGKVMPELRAHQLSTFTGILLFAAYAWLLTRRWPLESTRQALLIGCIWLVLTIAFEFGFGRLVTGASWERLLHDYNLFAGRLWVLVLAAVAVLPLIMHKLRN